MAKKKRASIAPPASTELAAVAGAESSVWRGLAPVAAVWMAIVLVELALNVVVPGTALDAPELSLGAVLSLIAYNVLLLGVTVAALGAAFFTLGRAALGATRTVRWAIVGLQGVLVWLPMLLYGASWAAFWNAGVFLDRAAFVFWAPHPIQVFHWVYPPLAVGVLIGTVIGAVLFGWGVPRLVVAASAASQHRLTLASAALIAMCAAVATVGGFAYANAQQGGQPVSPYIAARDLRTGPVAHAITDFWDRSGNTVLTPTSLEPGRPLISLEQYVATVDQTRVRRLNVVMVQFESLRSDQLRAYGSTRDVMPAVDAVATEARVFTNAYVQATHSNYADLVPLSSHYPLRAREMYEYPENPTYPRVLIYDVLKALGYKTAVVSSQNERWGGMINFHRPSSLDHFFHAEVYDGPTISPFEDAGFAEWVRQTRGAGSVDDRYTVDEAIRWLEGIGEAPFFLHMNLQSSHVPYVVPDDFDRPFGPDEIDFAIMWGRFPIDKVQIVKDRYADSLHYEDAQIARLFDYLRRRGLWENTVIVLGGDNGEAFYEHGLAAHASTPYEEIVRVPMVIRAPGIVPGIDDRPAMFLDIPPSLLDLMGLPPHPAFQGVSLFEADPDADRPVFTMVQTPLADQIAIVRSGLKLIYSEREGAFLYDLVRDSGERRSLAPSRPDLVEELMEPLLAWRDRQLAYYADVSRHGREYPP